MSSSKDTSRVLIHYTAITMLAIIASITAITIVEKITINKYSKVTIRCNSN